MLHNICFLKLIVILVWDSFLYSIYGSNSNVGNHVAACYAKACDTTANNNLSQLIIRITVLSLVLCKEQTYIDWLFKLRII